MVQSGEATIIPTDILDNVGISEESCSANTQDNEVHNLLYMFIINFIHGMVSIIRGPCLTGPM